MKLLPSPTTRAVSHPHPPRVLVFSGSTRVGSVNRLLAQAAARALSETGISTRLVDLRDYPMPLYDGDLEAEGGAPQSVLDFQRLVREHDALVIASPEYNGSFSALIKNVIDWISRPGPGEPPLAVFRDKTAAIMSASPGRGGGRRGLRHLRELLQMVGVHVIAPELAIASAKEAFSPDGHLVRPSDRETLRTMLEALEEAIASSRTGQVSRF
jgi:NAD(P)H-dependent FMN reductase